MIERYDYEEAVRNDINDYLDRNWKKGKPITEDDRMQLYEDMFVDDGVTGNGSGTYTFSTAQAEENVCRNLELLGEAMDDYGVDGDTLRDKMCGEWADVMIRCYLLKRLSDEAFDEWNERIEHGDEDGED